MALAVGDIATTRYGRVRVDGVPPDHTPWPGQYGKDVLNMRQCYLVVLLDGSEKAYLLPESELTW